MIVTTGSVVLCQAPLLVLLFAQFFSDLDVVVEYRGNDWYHVGLDDSGTNAFSAPNTYVDDTLKG